ncbi:MAG: Na(+)/H(+) antiporter subunit B [Alphaproteobacteria bacterium]
MKEDVVLRVVTKLLIPFILVFALYVQFHGELSPGGGFQAGVVFASAFVLYVLVYGIDAAERILPPGILRAGIAGGVLIFAGVGVAGMLLGANFLDYNVLASDPRDGQHIGIIVIEFGVGVTVTSVVIAAFYAFARSKS